MSMSKWLSSWQINRRNGEFEYTDFYNLRFNDDYWRQSCDTVSKIVTHWNNILHFDINASVLNRKRERNIRSATSADCVTVGLVSQAYCIYHSSSWTCLKLTMAHHLFLNMTYIIKLSCILLSPGSATRYEDAFGVAILKLKLPIKAFDTRSLSRIWKHLSMHSVSQNPEKICKLCYWVQVLA